MKKSIIIAQVGKSAYRETVYEVPGMSKRIKTNYSFEAVMCHVIENEKMDSVKLILVATKDSSMGSVYKAFLPDYKGKLEVGVICYDDQSRSYIIPSIDQKKILEDYEKDLSEKMKAHFKNVTGFAIDISVSVAIIEYGIQNDELQKNFNIIRTAIEEVQSNEKGKWDIYFDISNGFRSFPIYIYALINYLSRFGNSESKSHLFYGMFEAKEKKLSEESGEFEEEITPLVDLQVIDDLLLLINAVNEFRNCGSVVQIRKLLETHSKWDILIGDEEGETLSYAFELFDYGTNANNMTVIENAITLLIKMKDRIDMLDSLNNAEKLLLADISTDFDRRFGDFVDPGGDCPDSKSKLMIRLAEWYHEQGREGNAAITVQETIITCLMERYAGIIKYYLVRTLKDEKPKEKNLKEKLMNGTEDEEGEGTWLFEYGYRQPIAERLRNSLKNNTDFSEFYNVYDYIRNNIRNVAAHTIQMQADEPRKYKEKIKFMIDYMKEEIETEIFIPGYPSAKHRFDILTDEMFSEESRIFLLGVLSNTITNEWRGDRFAEKVYQLRDQICMMKKSNNFDEFYKKKGNLALLFSIIDEWIKDDNKKDNIGKEDYRKRFNKSKGKNGYERLSNFIENHAKQVVAILKKEEGEVSNGTE